MPSPTAFAASSAYLADAVERLTVTSRHVDTEASQQASHRAYLICDDAFRQFFAERGAKVVSVETISRLFTGSNRLRLGAFTLDTFPVRPPDPGQPEARVRGRRRGRPARFLRGSPPLVRALRRRAGRSAATVIDAPVPHGEVLHDVLRTAFEDVREQQRRRPGADDAADALGR